MPMTVRYDVTLQDQTCGRCGLIFAAPNWWWREKRANGQGWFCPNGCSRVFKEPEVDRLRRRNDQLRSSLIHERDQREAAERSAAAYKGHLTKLRKRIDQGVCPHCKRSFASVMRHMASKHPDKVEEARAALAAGQQEAAHG